MRSPSTAPSEHQSSPPDPRSMGGFFNSPPVPFIEPDSDRRESSVGVAGTTSNHTDDSGREAGLRCQWHPPQAMSGGRERVRGVEITDEVQVGMAFGKTSDHGTESNRTDATKINVPVPFISPPELPPELMDTRTGGMPVPLDVRRPISRTPNSGKRILFDDAHPP